MRPYDYTRATDPRAAVQAARVPASAHVTAPVQYLGGGTNLIDLMKLDVMRPTAVVDIKGVGGEAYRQVRQTPDGLRIGAMVTMAELADHPLIRRDYPVLSDGLWMAASGQLRNMARLGGNVLQRTRCPYFRDVTYAQCNKREPGSGCAAQDGHNRIHAVLGGSKQCIATYAGDWGHTLVALDATVEVLGSSGPRSLRFADLHRLPGDTPHIETTLAPGELITGFLVPGGPWPRSRYVKVRDRESYAFANASAAVAIRMRGDVAEDIRIALGGMTTKPWRATRAEALLRGRPITEAALRAAADTEFADARSYEYNAFKVPLGKATLVRGVLETMAMKG